MCIYSSHELQALLVDNYNRSCYGDVPFSTLIVNWGCVRLPVKIVNLCTVLFARKKTVRGGEKRKEHRELLNVPNSQITKSTENSLFFFCPCLKYSHKLISTLWTKSKQKKMYRKKIKKLKSWKNHQNSKKKGGGVFTRKDNPEKKKTQVIFVIMKNEIMFSLIVVVFHWN